MFIKLGLRQNVVEFGNGLLTGGLTVCTSVSGGVVLGSGNVFSVTVKNISGNAPVWVGGSGAFAPISGTGMVLYEKELLSDIRVDKVQDIRVFAENSGQRVSWFGVFQT